MFVENFRREAEWLYGLVREGRILTAIGYVVLSAVVVLVLVNVQRSRMRDP